jgi:hypothetical protein
MARHLVWQCRGWKHHFISSCCYKNRLCTLHASVYASEAYDSFFILVIDSYWYDFATNYWGAVYKHKADKHLKWKAGYESDNRIGWASLWVRHSHLYFKNQAAAHERANSISFADVSRFYWGVT